PPTATATPCVLPPFSDTPSDSWMWPPIRALACRGVVSGYSDGTFRPYAPVTRGQLAKMVMLASGTPGAIPSDQQTFADVPPGHPFWRVIETAASRGVISGYTCGGPG